MKILGFILLLAVATAIPGVINRTRALLGKYFLSEKSGICRKYSLFRNMCLCAFFYYMELCD